MADNTVINAGSGGDIIATDDIGGVKYQRVKPAWGADGSAVDVSEANPLPVAESGPLITLFSRLLNLLNSPMGYDKSLQRQRGTVILESGTVTAVTTVTTVTTVGAVTNVAGIGGYSAQMTVLDQNRSGWAQCVRARIT